MRRLRAGAMVFGSLLLGACDAGEHAADLGPTRDQGVADQGVADGGSDDAGVLCLAGRVGATPADASDVVYAHVDRYACFTHPFCADDGAADPFLDALLDCKPVGGGFYWGQGSAYVRVHGRAGGACVYDVGDETEGGLRWSRCTASFPVHAWPGLSYVDLHGAAAPNLGAGLDGCVDMGGCSVLPGAPAGPCGDDDGGEPIAPSCDG